MGKLQVTGKKLRHLTDKYFVSVFTREDISYIPELQIPRAIQYPMGELNITADTSRYC